MSLWKVLGVWLVVINLVTFFTFGWDKRAAGRGDRRVPEARLLLLSFLLGAPGGWLAMRVFRHKTVKSSFRVRFFLLAFLELALVGAATWWSLQRDSVG